MRAGLTPLITTVAALAVGIRIPVETHPACGLTTTADEFIVVERAETLL